MLNTRRPGKQSGITLLESLVAILVMAIGLLGIVGLQTRTLTDTQTGVRRAQAIRFVEDLSERTHSHPNALDNAASYTISFGAALGTITDCALTSGFPATSCTPAQLAAYDRNRWVSQVRAHMPLGDAAVFAAPGDTRQLGVMISWRENERAREGDTTANTDAYKAIFAMPSTGAAGVTCPAGRICHLQYISLNQRCIPITGTVVQCPGMPE